MTYQLLNANSFEWLALQPENSLHGVVTDPPYGVVEFTAKEVEKLRDGKGGIWRIPPSIGGSQRKPLPRFTVLTEADRRKVETYFLDWADLLRKPLVPGAHVLIATNVLLSSRVQAALERAGFEYRGQMLRLYSGFRGGDRPKLAESAYPEVSVTPRGTHEPWLLFRKPIEKGLRVSENLEKWGTGGLRRPSRDRPVTDVIQSERTPAIERKIADHPTVKPQSLMRPFVRMILPLGKGIVLDPFAGSGSTVAAAIWNGYEAIGIELDPIYYAVAKQAVPKLAALEVGGTEPSAQGTPLFG